MQCPRGCSRDLDAMRMSTGCANSMRHQPSACAMLRRSAACVRPRRRGERDANAEEATGEKQLLRLERPLCKALYVGPTYNALSKARPSMTNQENEEVMRFPHALHRPYRPLAHPSQLPLTPGFEPEFDPRLAHYSKTLHICMVCVVTDHD